MLWTGMIYCCWICNGSNDTVVWLANCVYADFQQPIHRYKDVVISELAERQVLVVFTKNGKVTLELDSKTLLIFLKRYENMNIYLRDFVKEFWNFYLCSWYLHCRFKLLCVSFLLLFVPFYGTLWCKFIYLSKAWQICTFEMLIIVRHQRVGLWIRTCQCSWSCGRY